MTPENGKNPTATDLLTELSSTQDNFQQHYILGKMLAQHIESDGKRWVWVKGTLVGLSTVVAALGAALIQYCMR